MRPAARTTGDALPLREGMRLSQPEFHRRYLQCPEEVKFELVGGAVYMASPVGPRHGRWHMLVSGLLWNYELATPGVCSMGEVTTVLGGQSEPQPDLSLRILREYGGQARVDTGNYLEGPPELLVEVADSTESFDLGAKRTDYESAEVSEYLVVCLASQQLRWFDFRASSEIHPRRGVSRSRVFPGLWVDGPALLAGDGQRLMQTLRQGLGTPAHARFVARLERARRRLARGGNTP